MANRPANAGSDRGLAGAPPPVHHQGFPRNPGTPPGPPPANLPANPAANPAANPPANPPAPPSPGHRARAATSRSQTQSRSQGRSQGRSESRTSRTRRTTRTSSATSRAPAAALPYLIVLAGVAAGLFITAQGSKYAGLGTGLVGGALLAAAAARLLLPARYTELLSSRWKASDVLAFTVLGAGVLAIALALP